MHSFGISLDPDNLLPPHIQEQFHILFAEYDSVFNPTITGYNGAVSPFQTRVNIVVPPHRKGHLLQLGKDKLVELQYKFDELQSLGVTVEYLSSSFLVKKPNCGHRLVTVLVVTPSCRMWTDVDRCGQMWIAL